MFCNKNKRYIRMMQFLALKNIINGVCKMSIDRWERYLVRLERIEKGKNPFKE